MLYFITSSGRRFFSEFRDKGISVLSKTIICIIENKKIQSEIKMFLQLLLALSEMPRQYSESKFKLTVQ